MNGAFRQEIARRVVATAMLAALLLTLESGLCSAAPANSNGHKAKPQPHYSVSFVDPRPYWTMLDSPHTNKHREIATSLGGLPCVISRKGTNFLGTFGYGGLANALNDHGQIAGACVTKWNWWSSFYQACLWDHGQLRELDDAPLWKVYRVSEACWINEQGDAVGYQTDWDEPWYWGDYGVLWKDGRAINLNDCIDSDAPYVAAAYYITNQGEIFVNGIIQLPHGGLDGAWFLLTPDKPRPDPHPSAGSLAGQISAQ